MQSALLNRYFINVFQMNAFVLLLRAYYLNKQQTMYVSIYLNDDNLKPEEKTGTPSGHAVLSEKHWYILVTFKGGIPKNETHVLREAEHTISVYCGRYIFITSEKTQVF